MNLPKNAVIKASVLVLFLNFLFAGIANAQPTFPNPDIQKTQTFDTTLELTGNQTMTIQNTHYKVNGSIILRDSSTLIVRQSVIELLGAPGEKQIINLLDSSSLIADTTIFGGANLTGVIDASQVESIKIADILADHNSRITMNHCFSLLQTFMGNSRVVIRNSTFWQEPLGLVHAEGNSDVLFEDCIVGAFFIALPHFIPVQIDSLRPGYFEYWSVKENISDSITYNLVLRRTEVRENTKGFTGGVEIGWNIAVDALKSNVTISNSKLHKLIIGFPDQEPAILSDLLTRKPINFDLNNIHLVNTEVQTQWGVFMNGGPANILNSEGLFIFMTGGDEDILVVDSEVGEIDPRKYNGSLIFENSTWMGGYEIFDSSAIKIKGSVRMLPTVPIFDNTSTMTRSYDVVLLDDMDDTPFVNIPLALSYDESIVWNGTTDTDGKVAFDITFDEDNHLDEWILTAGANHIKLKKGISIKSSNPVIINLEKQEDGNLYQPVLHVASENPNTPLGTIWSPYTDIQEAIDQSGGAVIRVHPGEYTGAVEPGKTRGGITLRDSVIITGAGADSVILTGHVNAENVAGGSLSGLTIEDGIHSISSSLTLTNSVIAGFDGTAIWGTYSDFQVYNNVLYGNAQDAIFLHDSSTAIIKNNIIVNNTGYGIIGLETSSAIIDYNDVWGNTGNNYGFVSSGVNDISEDPRFAKADTGNFYLQPGSPCIDAGDPDPGFNDPDGSRNDMGAFGGPHSSYLTTGVVKIPLRGSAAVLLHQNTPNPFSEETHIHFELPRDGWVNLSIYNMVGQKIRVLVNEIRISGFHSVKWDAKDESGIQVEEGLYFYQITTDQTRITRKAILMKY